MNTIAIVIMLVAMLAIWGGLALSVIHLMKNPDIDISQVPDDH
ncbi:methionine/alanine import family NSS transporter small subunit [Moraxella sp.]|nr:methionine/alanine import family NSS transporter small subunit [Moraxella sp.]MDO4895313.1 methionine/alanine import family NSS transporter small subunit [Moraxella sp.]